jgi:hypothetical protein
MSASVELQATASVRPGSSSETRWWARGPGHVALDLIRVRGAHRQHALQRVARLQGARESSSTGSGWWILNSTMPSCWASRSSRDTCIVETPKRSAIALCVQRSR